MELLWTDFLNSEWHDWRGSGRSEDRLSRPDWLDRLLQRWALQAPVPPEPADLAALHELRALLRRMTASLREGGALDPADLARLNQVMAAGPVVRQVAGTEADYRLEHRPLEPGWPGVMAEIATSFSQTLTEGEAARIRICANPDCLWVFYDETRNRTKRFCDEKACGNLIKVRRHRARKRAAAPGTDDGSP